MPHDPTRDQHRPADHADADVPPSLLGHETGLSPQRLRELIAAEDAYTRRHDGAVRPSDAR